MDLKDRRDLRDQPELLGQQGRKDLREMRGWQELQAPPARQDRLDRLERLDPWVRLDPRELQEHKDRQDRLELQGRQAPWARLGCLALLDLWVQQVPPARQELRVQLESKVHPGQPVRRAYEDLQGRQDLIGYKSRLCIGTRPARLHAILPVGTSPFGIAFDGAFVWIVNNGSGNVTKLRASDGAYMSSYSVRKQSLWHRL